MVMSSRVVDPDPVGTGFEKIVPDPDPDLTFKTRKSA
jgi:hypothetical protein